MKEWICESNELRWHGDEFSVSIMHFRWAEPFLEVFNFEAYFYLPALSLDIRKQFSQERKGFLMDKAQAVVRQSSFTPSTIDILGIREKRVHEVNGLFICHGKLKASNEGRRFSVGLHFALKSNVTFCVNEASKVSKMPLFHNLSIAH